MAPIKNSLLALVAAVGMLPSFALAAPLNKMQKRALVVETVTDVVVTTIDVTTTVYDPNYTGPPASTSIAAKSTDAGQFFAANPTRTPSVSPFVAVPSSSSAPPPPPSSSPSSSTTVAPATTQAPAVQPPPVTSSASASPVVAFESSTSAAAQPTSSSSSSSSGGSGGSGGQCSSSSPCTGDITFYTAGLGACGVTNDGSTEDIVALPVGMMGSVSNGNSFCGKTVTIKNGGKTAKGVVQDKCMGCTGQSIDLSNHLFDQLADESQGRVPNVEWFFD